MWWLLNFSKFNYQKRKEEGEQGHVKILNDSVLNKGQSQLFLEPKGTKTDFGN